MGRWVLCKDWGPREHHLLGGSRLAKVLRKDARREHLSFACRPLVTHARLTDRDSADLCWNFSFRQRTISNHRSATVPEVIHMLLDRRFQHLPIARSNDCGQRVSRRETHRIWISCSRIGTLFQRWRPFQNEFGLSFGNQFISRYAASFNASQTQLPTGSLQSAWSC